jgi:hypothetical protein
MKWRLTRAQAEKELPGVVLMGWGDGKRIADAAPEGDPNGIKNGENP